MLCALSIPETLGPSDSGGRLRRWEAALYLTSNCASTPVAALSSNVFGTRYELLLDASVQPYEERGAAGGGGAGGGGGGAGGGPGGWLGGARRDKPQELASVLYKTKLRGFMRPRRCAHAVSVHMSCARHFWRRGGGFSTSQHSHSSLQVVRATVQEEAGALFAFGPANHTRPTLDLGQEKG